MPDDKPMKINKAIQKPATRSPLPLTASDLRKAIIEASGVSIDQLAETFELAVTRLQEAMHATKVTYHTFKGQVIETSIDRDWSTILKAIDEFATLTGVSANKAQTQINIGDRQFIVNVPFLVLNCPISTRVVPQ